MTVCHECGGTVIEYDAAAGNGFCVQCGTVVEENTIVNEVSFGETSTGAAMVQGSFVGQGATHARLGGPFGNRGSSESREQTIANASRKIHQVATALRLSEVVSLAATRLYTLAVEHKFTKGRKSMNVVAVCLYVACRQKETRNYMLIDFSDLLQVNVFELGHTYLQLVQTLNLRLPLVDPSHYISRFAALLEFGEETHQVAMDAVRLVQRFDRDWMTRGRRPAGICGACLLLAARMNNFRRSVAEIVQVVKIADTTLKKRLEEFRNTPSGQLTLADFRNVWLEEEMDPPAFTKGREREEREKERLGREGEEDEEEGEEIEGARGNGKKGKGKGKEKANGRKKKRKRDEDVSGDDEDLAAIERVAEQIEGRDGTEPPIDPALLNEGILRGTVQPLPLFLPDDADDDRPPGIDPTLSNADSMALDFRQRNISVPPELPLDNALVMSPSPESPLDETVTAAVTEEVSDFLLNPQGASLRDALEEAEQRRMAQYEGDDELLGLDEDELDRFILTEGEVKIKERVWVELNKDYLEAIAAKSEQQDNGKDKKSRKRRKTSNKPRDASNAHGSTAAESVRNLLKKNPRYSKRINYDALKDLFTDSAGAPTPPSIDDKADGLFVIDEKDEGEGLIVVEEPGTVEVAPLQQKTRSTSGQALPSGHADDDDEADEDAEEGSDKGEDYAEWDGYEQEV